MTAAVVILNWNKAAQTARCLDAARSTTMSPVHWIVVDNGSTEPMPDPGDGVTMLRVPRNLGFAGGANLGLRHAFAAGAGHVWLLNNDAEPLPGALDVLLAVARADPSIGLASAVILHLDGTVAFHGGINNDQGERTTTEAAEYARWSTRSPERIWLVGTALLFSRALFERIGGFDERLFAYWEDNDISRRSAAVGYRNVVVQEAWVRHEAESPTLRPAYYHYYMTRNELLLLHKNGLLGNLRPLVWALRRAARLAAQLDAPRRRAVGRAVFDGLLCRGGAYEGRSRTGKA